MDIRLGLRSAYSLLFGVHSPKELIDKAYAYGINTVSICDINNLYGVHSYLEAAKERGIRPIVGAALTRGKNHSPAVYCFVENRAGFGRLCEILSARSKDIPNFDPATHLKKNASGLVLASADGEILHSLAGNVKRLYAAITLDDLSGLGLHRALSLPLAFLDTSTFFDNSDYAVHRVLRAIGLNKTVGNLEPQDTIAAGSGILKPSPELQKRLKSWPEAMRGTAEIAETAEFYELFNGFIFPGYGESPGDELRRRTYEGAHLRYGALGDGEIDRIEYELGIIEKMGFSPYFLRIDDIVKMASRTCGRGSGAASIVSYSLGITNVDPIAHNLYFERFLNPSRPDPPDFDVDFAWDERDALIQAVIEKFGPEYCARVANHNFFKPRSALRETAKAYGFSDGAISQLGKKIFTLREKMEKADPLWDEIFQIASRIEGLPHSLGMHCGGLVITPEPINRFVPIEKSREGYPLLTWEKEGTEAAGFVKIDLLGNRSLAVIRDILTNLEEQGIFIDPHTWRPADDRATVEALAHGNSIGVFYIESPAMRQLQKKTGKGDFEHIVIHSSIIRPAANKFIAEYVQRLKGKKWEPLHPRLEYILDETYGILCYQEDVSKTAVALAGFNEADADRLRKVIAKKAGGSKLAMYEKQFFDGCKQNGVPEETVKKIWAMMLSFDGYSFCKPHSASYAMVSFQSAFLRVHYPAGFIAAVLSNQGGYYRPHAYIAEARRMGLATVGPDINVSRWKYYGKSRDVVIGLMAIKGLSVSGAEKIINEREKNGDYTSLDDFSRRVKPGRDDIVALCPAGVFDSIASGLTRPMQARRLLSVNTGNNGKDQGDLFSAESVLNVQTPKAPILIKPKKTIVNENDLWEEYRALGFLRNNHPLVLWKEYVLSVSDRIKAIHIEKYIGRPVKMVGWPVTQKEVWTKDGLTMSFLSLEDETGLYETVIFPQIYDRYNTLLFDQQPLLVYGQVMSDEGAISLEIKKIEPLGKKVAI
ncbi:DNA polymerase III subunit alpha [Treponema sp. OttesenSCG-928-L16]|nr:DNA polymerase III subunit alpha [Treponema sp. OttesenSCG-928-L16]